MRWPSAQSNHSGTAIAVPAVITITPSLLPPSEEHEATRKRIEQLQARRERLKEQAHELADAIRQNDTLIRAEKAKEAVFADPLALDSSPVGTFELDPVGLLSGAEG